MANIIYKKTEKHDDEYFCEQKISLNGEEGFKYVIVGTDGSYRTFDGSYLDYMNGDGCAPTLLEKIDYPWVDESEKEKKSKYLEIYEDGHYAAFGALQTEYIKEKYASIKKPTGKINYTIVSKRSILAPGSIPPSDIYEVEFKLEDGRTLYTSYDGFVAIYSMGEFSIIDYVREGKYGELLEEYEDFEGTYESEYYDLFYELESYIDHS